MDDTRNTCNALTMINEQRMQSTQYYLYTKEHRSKITTFLLLEERNSFKISILVEKSNWQNFIIILIPKSNFLSQMNK